MKCLQSGLDSAAASSSVLKRGVFGDIQTELAYLEYGILGDQDLDHAGPPTAELLGQKRVEVLTEQTDVGSDIV